MLPLEDEPYRRPGRRRRRGPGRSFFDNTDTTPLDGRPLLVAIQSQDMRLAQGLLLAQADPNSIRDQSGRSMLQIATTQGLVGLCRQLTLHGAELDAGNSFDGTTALHQAVISGHNLVLKLLIEAHATVNICNFVGETPLSIAVGDGNINAVQQLMKAKAQLDVKEEDHFPLSASCSSLAAALEEAGSESPGGGNGNGNGAGAGLDQTWRSRSSHRNSDAASVFSGVAALRRSSDASSAGSALIRAMQRNAQKELVEELAANGAELGAKDNDANGPLHLAVRQNSLRVARLLLEQRADPNYANKDLRTPLHCAASLGSVRAVRLLTEHRADVLKEDSAGVTPLQLATDPSVLQTLRRAAPPSTPASLLAGPPAPLPGKSWSSPSLSNTNNQDDLNVNGSFVSNSFHAHNNNHHFTVGVGNIIHSNNLSSSNNSNSHNHNNNGGSHRNISPFFNPMDPSSAASSRCATPPVMSRPASRASSTQKLIQNGGIGGGYRPLSLTQLLLRSGGNSPLPSPKKSLHHSHHTASHPSFGAHSQASSSPVSPLSNCGSRVTSPLSSSLTARRYPPGAAG